MFALFIRCFHSKIGILALSGQSKGDYYVCTVDQEHQYSYLDFGFCHVGRHWPFVTHKEACLLLLTLVLSWGVSSTDRDERNKLLLSCN